jgi:hypothetical protein
VLILDFAVVRAWCDHAANHQLPGLGEDGVAKPVWRSVWARALVAALALFAVACSQRGATLGNDVPGTTAAGPTAAGELPERCARDAPSPDSAPVAFVADGRAWAASADGSRVWCLFEVRRPGPFLWGPRGDRVVLDGLEVRGVGSRVSRPPRGIAPVSLTWLGPAGNALAFVSPGRLNLEWAAMGSIDMRELTPLRDVTYQAVAAHPSGRALAFAVQRNGGAEIWVASDAGTGAVALVSAERARYGPLAFSITGQALFYASKLPDGTRRVEVYSLTEGNRLAPAWTGRRDVLATVVRRDRTGAQLAVDTGGGCGDRRAELSDLSGSPGRPLLPASSRPTSAVGWLSSRKVLVAEGGCEGPLDLWVVDVGGGEPAAIARGVDRGAVRSPDPRPVPPAPDLAALARAAG